MDPNEQNAEALAMMLAGKWVWICDKSEDQTLANGKGTGVRTGVAEIKMPPMMKKDAGAGLALMGFLALAHEFIEAHPQDCPCDVRNYMVDMTIAVMEVQRKYAIKNGVDPNSLRIDLASKPLKVDLRNETLNGGTKN